MKLINSSVEIIEQKPDMQGIYEQIELAARNCYKSEGLIKYDKEGNSTTAKDFVDKIVNVYKHQSVAEHGTVYLTISYDKIMEYVDPQNPYDRDILCNPWTKYVVDYANDVVYISSNYRWIIENNLEDWLQYLRKPIEYHEKRVTVRFICDRGVMAEITRHRSMSFSIESTRYCNYSKNKFGNKLTFIIPTWLNDKIEDGSSFSYDANINNWQKSEDANTSNFLQSIAWAEKNYLTLLYNGLTPQQARAVLPNALKTEVIMTGFISDYQHFFDLRCAENAHPDIRKLAIELKEEFIKREYING